MSDRRNGQDSLLVIEARKDFNRQAHHRDDVTECLKLFDERTGLERQTDAVLGTENDFLFHWEDERGSLNNVHLVGSLCDDMDAGQGEVVRGVENDLVHTDKGLVDFYNVVIDQGPHDRIWYEVGRDQNEEKTENRAAEIPHFLKRDVRTSFIRP